jgi:hypothetical protein
MSPVLDPRFAVPGLLVVVGLSAAAAQLDLGQPAKQLILFPILLVAAATYYGIRALVIRRDARADSGATPPKHD